MKRNTVMLIFATVLLSVTARPDHLDDNQISQTRSEHLLVGMNVWRDEYTNPRSLNAAAHVVDDWQYDWCIGKDCAGDEEVTWEAKGCVVRVMGVHGPGPNKIRRVAGVEVVPSSAGSGRECATGRGLALSDTFRKAVALYGRRYLGGPGDSHGWFVLYEWKDGGQMELNMDRHERITRIKLMASEGRY